ncbi:MAG: HAD hydrolase family protein [Firmicutes bacterium]|nr:HAD hydrolase family protein [Bacillota bacterium]MCL5038390.1 HAD hydrolase family protein [Bacillota bacterium]
MLKIDIPGYRSLHLEHLVLDYNGTLAVDGRLLPGVGERLTTIAEDLSIHVLTADTFGRAGEACHGLPVSLHIIPGEEGAKAKEEFVANLGAETVVAMGNGRNDAAMLRRAGLGIAVLGPEGAAAEAVQTATILVRESVTGLDLLLEPKRLVATLRG